MKGHNMSPIPSRSRRAALVFAASLAVLLGGTGCSFLTPGAASDSEVQYEPGKKLTTDDVAALGDVTLRITDGGDAGPDSRLSQTIAKFEEDFPNITVKRDVKAFGDYSKTINLVMSGDDAPDIAEADGAMAPRLYAGKLLRPIDDYFDEYGWEDRYPSTILSSLKIEPDGKSYGTGEYWGVTTGGELVGVYYNVAKLEEAGLQIPTTFDEFESALATLHDKGEVPIQLGNLDQWSGSHVFSTMLNNFQDPQTTQDWINGQSGATFETDGVAEALGTFKNWFTNGYISDQANGILDDDAVVAFTEGQGAFLITGTWRTADVSTALGDDGGFMLMPPMEAGGQSHATGSYQGTYSISSKSENADLAAFFLDYITGPTAASFNETGDFLGFTGSTTAPEGSVAEDVLNSWNDALEDNGLVGYLDSAAPAMGDSLFPKLQELMAGQQTPEQVMVAVQSTWDSYRQGS